MNEIIVEGEVNRNPIIKLIDVEIGYDYNQPLVKIPDLEIFPGEIVAIAGPSGVGKTTLLRTIAGLVRPISGMLEVCGATHPSKPVRGSLGYVPQRLGLVRHTSVIHNVMIGANAGHNKSLWSILTSEEPKFSSIWSKITSKHAKRNALSAIESMGLTEKLNEPIRKLSGGQQRRVATARTLAQQPSLIMADEFLSELDEETMKMVLNEVTEYIRNSDAALLVVEHDISRAKSMADRLLVIDDGRVNPFISEVTAIEVKI